MSAATFPQLTARDLEGHEVALPGGLPTELTVVLVAFRREQQRLVDSWVPRLEDLIGRFPRVGFVELPVIGLLWAPGRRAIDGGMAAAIPDPRARQRTLTVYTDVRRVTAPLGITDRDTITVCLVDRSGRVWWKGSGGFDAEAGSQLEAALAAALGADLAWPGPVDLDAGGAAGAEGAPGPAGGADGPLAGVEQFGFDFDPRFRLVLAAVGATPTTSHVTIGPDRLLACLGPWSIRVAPHNIRDVSITGPYHWYRGIGIRLSLTDRGLTFGTTYAHGVCLTFREPVRGPLPGLRHPNLTLTVADPQGLAAAVRRHAGLVTGSSHQA